MTTPGERIRKVREDQGIGRKKLADYAGIAYSTLADLENGKSSGTTVLDKIAERLGVRTDYLRTGHGPKELPASPDSQDWADILGVQQAAALGEGAVPDEYAETHKLKFRADSLRRKHLRPDKLAVIYGRGESMTPTIEDGDAILFDTSDTEPKDNGLYVITYDGELYAKRLMELDGAWYAKSDNDSDPKWRKPRRLDPSRGLAIAGRIRWVAGWVD